MDAYHKGLQGEGVAWAVKKYWGVPMTILEDYDDAVKAGKAWLHLKFIFI